MDTYQAQGNADVSAGLSEHNVHQWAKDWSLDERKSYCKEVSYRFEVVVVNVTGELNVGNIIRTASLCGAQKVHVLGRRKFDSRGTVGAANYIDVHRIDLMDGNEVDCELISGYFQIKQLYPIFVEQSANSVTLSQTNLQMFDICSYAGNLTPCFVFGNEGRGVPQQLIDMYEHPTLELMQRGVIRSFNVGSTAAIVLYAAQEFYRGKID